MNLPPPDLPPESEPDKTPASSHARRGENPPLSDSPPVREPVSSGSGPAPAASRPRSRAPLPDAETIIGMIKDAITYPLRGGGWAAIIPGVVLACLCTLGGWVPFAGWAVVIGASCYMTAFYFRVIESTVSGKDVLPDWPEFSNFLDDIILPGFQMLVIYLVALAPALALAFLGGLHLDSDDSVLGLGEILIMMSIAAYSPMGVLGLLHFGTLGAAMPHRVIPAIVRCMPAYLIAAGAVFFELFANHTVSLMVGWIPILGSLIEWAVLIYLMIVSGRLIGVMYRQNQAVVGW